MTTDLSLVISVRVLLCNEFVVFLCLTARGSSRERSYLLFSLCDLDRVGGVTFKNLMKVLESINKLGKATEHYSLNIKILVHIPQNAENNLHVDLSTVGSSKNQVQKTENIFRRYFRIIIIFNDLLHFTLLLKIGF